VAAPGAGVVAADDAGPGVQPHGELRRRGGRAISAAAAVVPRSGRRQRGETDARREGGRGEGLTGDHVRRCGVGGGRVSLCGGEGRAGGARGAATEAGGVPLRAAAVRCRDAPVHGLPPPRRHAADHRAPSARVRVPQPAAVRAPTRRHGRGQLYRRGQWLLSTRLLPRLML
jgi:hypothetical protein